jgi:ribosomal protein S18 acetylase RimI-like enzyme
MEEFTEYSGLSPDQWLSERLGKRVYNLSLSDPIRPETHEALRRYRMESCMITCKVNPLKSEHIRFLENSSFRLVDTGITFQKSIKAHRVPAADYDIRFARPEDEDKTASLAFRGFEFSRFHLDPFIGTGKADLIKSEWVRNYFKHLRGDSMILTARGDDIYGFLMLLHGQEQTLTIDLIAVDSEMRRKGIAASMIAFAENTGGAFNGIRAGTQLTNVTAMKFYEDLGFRITSAHHIFHFHSGEMG